MEANTPVQPVNPSEIPIQSQPIQPPPVNNQKGFLPIILGVIILILVVGGVAYYLGNQQNIPTNQVAVQPTPIVSPTIVTTQPSPIETLATPNAGVKNDWKIYQSKRFSVKFSYPSKYVLVNDYENTYPDQGFIHLYTQEGYELVKSKAGRGSPDFIQVGAYSNPKHLTALEWAKSDTSHSNFTETYTIEKIAGEDALSYSFEGMGTGIVRVVAHGSYIYTLDVMGNPEMNEDFKQILPTVEFVK